MNKLFTKLKNYEARQLFLLLTYFILGHIIGAIFYKKKYYYGKWFKGNFGGIAAPGWRWICVDFFSGGRKQNGNIPWPCSPYITVGNYKNIHFHPDDVNNFQGKGNLFQTWSDGHIFIGKGTWIAMNVGIITTNHSTNNPDEHDLPKNVILGKSCWIGMNSMILPGVVLGNHTIVGAGSVVTKSFPEGNCVIAGNPAHKIRDL